MTEITLTDRQTASKVIEELRQTLTRSQVAEFIGINPSYVTTAMNRTRKGDGYHCPPGVIRKILAYPMKEELNTL